ncbi:hypothetical protein GCM10010508_39750 [Streptomyces naganishii JCM 4654]|uniref:Uncharacterized protein n=1 Tax=Streptomyces naganishii JCM 4654 TaxID=1306179 RepID=A0A919CY41_9ACTN|nr:hypothetical protein GCM10010508_39750 [Streptomyces naganishii JCM 4654]
MTPEEPVLPQPPRIAVMPMAIVRAIIPVLRRCTACTPQPVVGSPNGPARERSPVLPQGEDFQNVSHKVYTTRVD